MFLGFFLNILHNKGEKVDIVLEIERVDING